MSHKLKTQTNKIKHHIFFKKNKITRNILKNLDNKYTQSDKLLAFKISLTSIW